MMRKIDWYILKKFLTTFFFSLILLTTISTVIDISEHTDDFAKSGLTANQIIMQYYVGFIPFIVSMLFPLFVFISVIFFTSKMANLSEFIAILSSGVSLQRILRPYWVGGILLGSILWYARRFLMFWVLSLISYQHIMLVNLHIQNYSKRMIKVGMFCLGVMIRMQIRKLSFGNWLQKKSHKLFGIIAKTIN